MYATAILYTPESFIKKVDKDIQKFIWKNKPPKIKSTTLINSLSAGGLNMPSFDIFIKAQKAMWIKRMLDPNSRKWERLHLV